MIAIGTLCILNHRATPKEYVGRICVIEGYGCGHEHCGADAKTPCVAHVDMRGQKACVGRWDILTPLAPPPVPKIKWERRHDPKTWEWG